MLTVTANDQGFSGGPLQSSTQQLELAIRAFNDAPVATDSIVATNFNTPATGTLSAADPETASSSLAYAVGTPGHGAVTLGMGGAYTYTPTSDYSGTDSFTFTATDASGEVSNTATVSIDVAAAPSPSSGAEFLVNSHEAGDQQLLTQGGGSKVAALADGSFVATWDSIGQDLSGGGVYGQRFDSAGTKLGSEFLINTSTSGDQSQSAVTGLKDGGFFAAWAQEGGGVYGQRYGADGTQSGGEFMLATPNNQNGPSVSGLGDGGFVATWNSGDQDIHGQRFDVNSNPVGPEFRVNTYTPGNQLTPATAGLADGSLVVSWLSYQQDTDGDYNVYAQRYDANGNTLGGEFRVNTSIPSNQNAVFLAALHDGGFVATWMSLGQDGNSWGIYGQRYDANGNSAGGEFRANTTTSGDELYPSVAALTDGGFVVGWTGGGLNGVGNGQDGSGEGAFAQRYDSSGNPIGGEFQLNVYSAGNQSLPELVGLHNGGFAAVWTSTGQDDSGNSVHGRIFSSGVSAKNLAGGDGNDTLMGSLSADSISGGAGNDLLIGGKGTDTLTGGVGSDRFDYNSSNEGLDTITDFAQGTGGDVLDVRDLLVGYTAGVSDPADFLQLVENGGSTIVNVNADGNGSDFVALATLQNVTFTAGLLNDLVANGNVMLA